MRIAKSIFILLILTLILVGCKANEAVSESAMPETTDTVLAGNTPTAPFISEPTQEPLATTPPQTTLSPKQAQEKVLELLETNGGCELPCWWGITPGEKSWEEIFEFLKPLAVDIRKPTEEFPYAEVLIPVPLEIEPYYGWLLHDYSVENGIVKKIEVQTGNIAKYSLSNMLSKFGKPNEVRIKIVFLRLEQNIVTYYLFYPDRGILALYSSFALVNEENVIICPRNESDPLLILWSPVETKTAGELLVESDLVGGPPEEYTLDKTPNINEISNMNVEEFYTTFLDPNTDVCIVTLKSYWPTP